MTRQDKSKDEGVRCGLFESKQRCLDMGTILVLPELDLQYCFQPDTVDDSCYISFS